MMIQFVANQEKINFNFHSAGGLDSYGAMSYEKYVTDLEILGMIEYYLADLNTDPRHLATEVIEQVGAGGEFITNLHTVQHCRTAPFASAISVHGPLKEGKKANDALRENMVRRLDSMLDSYSRPELPPETQTALEAYLNEHGIDPDLIRKAEGDMENIRPAND
jgi:trimethylamine--corrinoid protein Co-methyltransferase